MKNVPTSKDKIKFILKLNKIPTEIIVCIHPQINEKRKEVNSKGERERHTQMKAEFQRIARRDKKAFLSEQCKEID